MMIKCIADHLKYIFFSHQRKLKIKPKDLSEMFAFLPYDFLNKN